MDLPATNSEYGRKQYWEERFEKEEQYEWLVPYSAVKELLNKEIKKTDRILVIGCGNSSLGADMYDDGFKNIVNIDYAESAINKQLAKNGNRPDMQFLVMDILDLKFEDHSFDVVLDKATVDALQVDEGDPWSPNETVLANINRVCTGISRVLKPSGKFIQISFQQPHFRRKYLQRSPSYAWDYRYTQFGNGFGYFFYVCDKHHATSEDSKLAA